jgi:hypothetical protein
MPFYIDNDGRRQSGHLQKDCQTFQALQRATERPHADAVSRGYVQGPRSEVHVPLPPPPAITSANQHQLQIAGAPDANKDFTPTRGAVAMIQKGRPSNRSQKLISRQVYMVVTSPPPTTEYLNWSGQPIGFTQENHPPQVPRLGHSAMILPAVIEGYDVSRIFIDGGSCLNLIYADTLQKMNISLANLTPTDTCFHGIAPEKPNYPLGKIALDV